MQPRRTATQSTLNGSKCHHHSQDNQLTVLTLCVKTKLAQQANGLLPRPHTHKEVYREARKKRGCGWKHKSCSKQSNSKHQSHSNQSLSKPAFLHYWLREAPMSRLPTTHERAQKNEILIKTCKLSDLKAAQLPELPSPPLSPTFIHLQPRSGIRAAKALVPAADVSHKDGQTNAFNCCVIID